VIFIGEIDERQKTKFLGEAAALLFPVDWPEPFGLVMIEAMACGTPVLAFRCGSVPEVIEDDVIGKVVGSEEEAVAAFRQSWLTIAARCGNGLKKDLRPQEWPETMSALIASC
jgi:glycosyltransferase involved in cell wall biosynthesis